MERKLQLEPLESQKGGGQRLLFLFYSVAVAILYFALWPTDIVVDDGGITLKYLDNFANGIFYAYNAEDGPVYGLSSFLYGILAGTAAYIGGLSGLISPLGAAFVVNFVFFVLTSFLLLSIISTFTQNHLLILVASAAVLFTAPRFVINIKNALETTLHVAIIFSCFYAFYTNRLRLLLVCSALALMTKLDSLPIVGVLGMAFIIHNRHLLTSFDGWRSLLWNSLLYGLLPLGIWLVAVTLLFGSPLPQSAYAKIYYLSYPERHGFPFLQDLLNDRRGAMNIVLFLGLMAVFLIYGLLIQKLEDRWATLTKVLASGVACIGYFALFYYYNPLERHTWYHAIPELLIRLQIVVIGLVMAYHFLKRHAVLLLIPLCFCYIFLNWPNVIGISNLTLRWLNIVEGERIAVGQWIRQASRPDDILFTGHGHIARESKLYSIDYSGLNSRIVTDYELNQDRLIQDLQPEWVVQSGIHSPEFQMNHRYQLRKAFYNIASFNTPSWYIFEHMVDQPLISISYPLSVEQIADADEVHAGNNIVLAKGQKITLSTLYNGRPTNTLMFGIVHAERPMLVTASLYDETRQITGARSLLVKGMPTKYSLGRETLPWKIHIADSQSTAAVELTALYTDDNQSPATLQIYDPVVLQTEENYSLSSP